MKLKNLLALLLALALTLSCGAAFAEEAAPAETAETPEAMEGAEGDAAESGDMPLFDSVFFQNMEVTIPEYMAAPETRAMSAVLMLLEMMNWNDAATLEIITGESLPTLYITASSELGDNGLSVYYFYPDLQKMVLATYVASLNQCHVAVLDAEDEPAAVMEGLVSEGILGSYEEISLTDYAAAMNQINQALQGE